ncbi:hypothetical protein [Vagococcus sp. WN89Y]|uniref:hypothetical protein n=1 Tax=Vagococcus sp. WN89Y TaxID=3457258 RepID=UPI003FCE33F2
MPVSSVHFRTQQGAISQQHEKTLKNAYENLADNTYANDTHLLLPHCLRSENSAEELHFLAPPLNMQRSAMARAVQFLLLLSQVRPTDAGLPLAAENALSLSSAPFLAASHPHPYPEVSQQKTETTPFLLTGTAAAPVPAGDNGITWNSATNSYTLTSEEEIKNLFSRLKDYLVAEGELTSDEGKDFELNMRSTAAGSPVLIFPIDEAPGHSPTKPPARVKRNLSTEEDPQTVKHIEEHCAFEEEVLDTQGKNKGKVLLFQAQRADKPFRAIYDNNPNGRPTPEERGIADGLNISFIVVTIGLMPLIGSMIASAKRREYYQQQGDTICAERYNHLMAATVLTSIDAGGLEYPQRAAKLPGEFSSLSHTQAFEDRAAFYTRNRATNIRKEILLALKNGKGEISDNGREIYLKPTEKENEFVTWYPHAIDPERLERKVVIDEKTLTWRYADTFDITDLDVEILEGKRYIELYGQNYELTKNAQNKYEIVVHSESGKTEYIPVYMEPLTKRWHIATHFAKPAFSVEQEKILNQYQAELNHGYLYVPELNNNPQYYGYGHTYHAEQAGDETHYVLGRYIEMNGKLIPVRQKVIPAHGVRYEIYDIKNPAAKAWQVEWDGNRWLFESTTSAQITDEVKKQITANMFITDIDVNTLSAPDSKGIRWNAEGKNFLKIDDKYIRVRELNLNRFAVSTPEGGNKIIIRLEDNKFHLESDRERLKNIVTVGFGGRKRAHPVEALKNLDGFNEETARELLAKYHFQKNGLYSADAFVLEIEQTGGIPYWAERFKIPRNIAQTSVPQETVSVIDSRFPELSMQLKLGQPLEEGTFFDADDNTFVIKKYIYDGSDAPLNAAIENARKINRFYGPGAAQLYHDFDKNYYLRTYHQPGEALGSLSADTLTADAGEKFVDMFEKTRLVGLKPNDFGAENIVWDAKSKSFHLGNALVDKPADTLAHSSTAKHEVSYWEDVLAELEQLVASQHDAPPVDNVKPMGVPQGDNPSGSGALDQLLPEQPETVVQDDKGVDTLAKAAESADASAGMSIEAQVAAKYMKKTPLDILFINSAPKYATVSEKLDEIINIIAANKGTALHKLQKLRLLTLKKSIKDAIDIESTIPQLEKFVDDNRNEVLNPGYAMSLPRNENYDYKTVERNYWLYNIRTSKEGTEAETLLYPEDRLVELQQAELDATKYETAVKDLPEEERTALRIWTGLPKEVGKSYSDNSISTGISISYELNMDLREEEPLTEELQNLYDNILSALTPGKLPVQKGEYIRTASYKFPDADPWSAGNIAVGDIVSNGKQFMSVSSDTIFAEEYAKKGVDYLRTIINYKIATPYGPTPLLPNALSLSTFENEYLYRPNTYFRVKEISVMEPLPTMHIDGKRRELKLPTRIGVVLEEVELTTAGAEHTIKDIFSGKSWTIKNPDTREEAQVNPVIALDIFSGRRRDIMPPEQTE